MMGVFTAQFMFYLLTIMGVMLLEDEDFKSENAYCIANIVSLAFVIVSYVLLDKALLNRPHIFEGLDTVIYFLILFVLTGIQIAMIKEYYEYEYYMSLIIEIFNLLCISGGMLQIRLTSNNKVK
ncbi:hypothetical protein D1003_02790 [Riemerella anatipestifer]|nr:hypothetical protein [Riemerella anatipestifer]